MIDAQYVAFNSALRHFFLCYLPDHEKVILWLLQSFAVFLLLVHWHHLANPLLEWELLYCEAVVGYLCEDG